MCAMTGIHPQSLVLGTRPSPLAMWQAEHVRQLLHDAWPKLTIHLRAFVTQGDRTLETPLPQIGGKGLFTQEIEQGLHVGAVDLAVHSLKDLPVDNPPGTTLGAIVGRADVRDVLIARQGWTLATLPEGAVVGTSSLRRQAQLLAVRPDLVVRSIRGNIETRIHKALETDYHATVLAAAGVTRLGLIDSISEWLPLTTMLPAPGQGALAVQCRADDEATMAILAAIDNQSVRRAVSAERAFLHSLGSGCSTPVAAHAVCHGNSIHLVGLVARSDGTQLLRLEASGDDPDALGASLAHTALRRGAAEILAYG